MARRTSIRGGGGGGVSARLLEAAALTLGLGFLGMGADVEAQVAAPFIEARTSMLWAQAAAHRGIRRVPREDVPVRARADRAGPGVSEREEGSGLGCCTACFTAR